MADTIIAGRQNTRPDHDQKLCRSVALDLLGQYLEVEEVFQSDGAATDQEIIDALRKVCTYPA